MDDIRAKVASRAQCQTTFGAFRQAERTFQGCLRYGPGKTAVQATGILDMRQVGQAFFQDSYECFGVWRGTSRPGEKQLFELAGARASTVAQYAAAMVHAELGFRMAWDCIATASLPTITFGAEVCVP